MKVLGPADPRRCLLAVDDGVVLRPLGDPQLVLVDDLTAVCIVLDGRTDSTLGTPSANADSRVNYPTLLPRR